MRRLIELAAKERRRVVGLMSGTSADGVDAVVVELSGCGQAMRYEVLAFSATEFPEDLRREVFALFAPQASLDALCRVNFALGEVLAQAALDVIGQAGFTPDEVDLIGSHGQTVRHLPAAGATLQIGEPAVIAARTGLVTIADFRPADMAQGGEGAPLVPLVDRLLFAHPEQDRLLLNIGGIANITVLPAGGDEGLAFDLGPGNMLIDAAVAHFSDERYDRDGARAARGRVDEALLAELMQHEFLQREPPKSTGREEFGAEMLEEIFARGTWGEDDLVATLTAFTVRSIAAGIGRFCPRDCGGLWIAGGGVHNPQIVAGLQGALPDLLIESLAALGVDPDAREALTFAVLANETLMGHPGNVPAATGARRAVVLGKVALP
jgi:anhydro-N-acetylmuramic acid kinase